ncbi:hypothetical protein Hte_002264 [Hypoxylon texense]
MNQFQVCPEYLTQGEDSNLVVMRMRVRVARLVAEAVLHIQHPWSPCYWSEKDVVFYALEADDGDPIPFLKVEVERQNGAASDTTVAGRPGRWLLNLALILLQLGLAQPIDAAPNDMGEEEY